MKPIKFLAAITITLAFSFTVNSQQPTNPVTLVNIAENIYEIQGGRGANGGLLIGEDGVIVIDAKMDSESVSQTIEEIRKLTDKPLRYLVNTHSDGDHVNGNRFFPPSVTIVAHENCREEFFLPGRDGSPSMWLTPDLIPYLPQITFNDRMDLHMGRDKVELWYFGRGHTSGDIVVYFPEQKVAFIGDQIFLNRVPLIHVHKGGNSHESVRYLERMLETLDAEKFSSGHSEVVGRDHVKAYIDRMKARQATIAGMIENNQTIEHILAEFSEAEAGLTQVIYNELTAE